MKRLQRIAAKTLLRMIAVLAVLLIILHVEENWRGARDWAAAQKELAEKGESLDLRQLIPPGRSDDDLSRVPIFAELYQQYDEWSKKKGKGVDYPGLGRSTARIDRVSVHLGSYDYSSFPKSTSYLRGEAIDMTAWQKAYEKLPEAHLSGAPGTPAQDVLKALKQIDPEMNEIDSAVSNPGAYWPINYQTPFKSYLGGVTSLLKVAQVIQLRGIAHLDNDDADSAEKDYLFSIRLNQSLRNGFMVDYLVAIADRTIDDAILWEGLRRHVWNVAQLNEMDSALGSKDLLKDAISSFRIERASGVQASYFLQKNNPTFIVDWGQDIDPRMYLLRFVGFIRPAGWWNQDRRRYSLELQTLIEAIDAGRGHLDGLVFDAKDAEKQKRGTWKVLYVPMSTLALSMGVSLGEKVAEAETYRRLARIACWLEEYRLTHQQYPDTLDQLPDLPSHLNQEVLTGKPLHYWRKEEGYVLYSTSWDQKDHGGVARTSATEKAYDWLWPSP